MALVSTFFQMFIVLGMYNFDAVLKLENPDKTQIAYSMHRFGSHDKYNFWSFFIELKFKRDHQRKTGSFLRGHI